MAVKAGKAWIDNDATRLKGGRLINDHGRPSRAYFHGSENSINFTWIQVKDRTHVHGGQVYHLRTIGQALRDNAAHKIGTEVEIKNLNPVTGVMLAQIMGRLARDAYTAYGPDWQEYVIVKVVSTHGLSYCFRICRAAHAAGLRTLISVRGKERLLSLKGHVEVTYVRGSLNRSIR